MGREDGEGVFEEERITAQFSDAGKIILMISMLIGRVGTITLAFALTSRRKDSQDYRYPNASVQVG